MVLFLHTDKQVQEKHGRCQVRSLIDLCYVISTMKYIYITVFNLTYINFVHGLLFSFFVFVSTINYLYIYIYRQILHISQLFVSTSFYLDSFFFFIQKARRIQEEMVEGVRLEEVQGLVDQGEQVPHQEVLVLVLAGVASPLPRRYRAAVGVEVGVAVGVGVVSCE